MRHAETEGDAVVEVQLLEQTGEDADGAAQWHQHERLALWPVPRESTSGPRRYVDILTDTDGDGIGDVNERLAGTSWRDRESVPGPSVIDVLALYTRAFHDAEEGYPYTRLQHVLTVVGAIYEDNGTNIRLRTVGMSEVELDEIGWAEKESRKALMDSHGADVSLQVGADGPSGSGGRADVGAQKSSRWSDARAWEEGGSILIAAHELGHVMGLAHSARQNEATGAWRWSRGHHVTPRGVTPRHGTIMASGANVLGGVFSDPTADCGGVPCGVNADALDGADAVSSLNLLRFQVAAHRAPGPDTDGDGFVDAADAAPDDPDDWFDVDNDGIADNADPDDDNDGTPDADDPFPLDSSEWADADLDGIGDNADNAVTDLSPFRDPGLRAAVENALGKNPGAPIMAEEMALLTELRAVSRDIRDLTGLELATGLERLSLRSNRVDNLEPLSGLTELQSIDVFDNRIVDLTPLSELQALTSLDLSNNPVTDISSLAGLTRCTNLQLNDTGVNYADVLALPYFDKLLGLGLAGFGIKDLSALVDLPLGSLNLAGNPISDLSPLSRLTALQNLNLSDTGTSDIEALAGLTKLKYLWISDNDIGDISPLSGMSELQWLHLDGNEVVDIEPLAGATDLKTLDLADNEIVDIGPIAGAVQLERLMLQHNRIADVSALAAMTRLENLDLAGNAVSDIGSLAGAVRLKRLIFEDNRVSDISPLSGKTGLTSLDLSGNGVSDIGPLAGSVQLEWLILKDNRISDVSPLAAMTSLNRLFLNNNVISDIGPLADRSIFGGARSVGAYVNVDLNPLDDRSLNEHIPTLRGWGIRVGYTQPGRAAEAARIADPTLRSLLADAVAHFDVHVDDPPSRWPIDGLRELRAYGRGIASLAGLEAAGGLETLYAASNRIADLAPLAGLTNLGKLDLRDNLVSDIFPLVSNAGLSAGDWVALGGNPLSEESFNTHVPELLERGVEVSVDTISVTLVRGGEPLRFDVSGYFEAVFDQGFELSIAVDDESIATVEANDGAIVVTPGLQAGNVNATVSATAPDGTTERVTFAVTVGGAWVVPLFPSASNPARQGFVRVINSSSRDGHVRIVAIDDAGTRKDAVTLALDAREAVHFNSVDLEAGNPGKGLAGSSGAGTGEWRLELESTLNLEVLSYIRTPDGFLTAMHDLAPNTETGFRVPIFNPASNIDQVSRLRLFNQGSETIEATVSGVDDHGEMPGSEVTVEIPAGETITITAAELEGGGPRQSGMLGDGSGKWRLQIAADPQLSVMNLLESPEGHLTNLSTGASKGLSDSRVHTVPLFPSASDPLGRQGFVRVVNRSRIGGVVAIQPFDDTGRRYEPLTLALDPRHAAHFNSNDLELGNAGKGISGSTGSGVGDWRLNLSSDLDIEVLAYVRTPGGFLTAMHDLVAQSGRRYDVATFNPASNANQASALRIVNLGSRPAHVSVSAVDDAGTSPGEVVRMTVPADSALLLSATQLESGDSGLRGIMGDGRGKWRLTVDSEQPLHVINLLASPTGHLTNLSTGSNP